MKAKKCVFGLGDAGRFWYLKLREELINLVATPERLDQGSSVRFCYDILFMIITWFVDDVLWGLSTQSIS